MQINRYSNLNILSSDTVDDWCSMWNSIGIRFSTKFKAKNANCSSKTVNQHENYVADLILKTNWLYSYYLKKIINDQMPKRAKKKWKQKIFIGVINNGGNRLIQSHKPTEIKSHTRIANAQTIKIRKSPYFIVAEIGFIDLTLKMDDVKVKRETKKKQKKAERKSVQTRR